MSTSNPRLSRLRGRSFTRLSPDMVETFTHELCSICDAGVSLNCLIISEPDDTLLIHAGLYREVKPSLGFKPSVHSPVFCSTCYEGWTKGREAGLRLKQGDQP